MFFCCASSITEQVPRSASHHSSSETPSRSRSVSSSFMIDESDEVDSQSRKVPGLHPSLLNSGGLSEPAQDIQQQSPMLVASHNGLDKEGYGIANGNPLVPPMARDSAGTGDISCEESSISENRTESCMAKDQSFSWTPIGKQHTEEPARVVTTCASTHSLLVRKQPSVRENTGSVMTMPCESTKSKLPVLKPGGVQRIKLEDRLRQLKQATRERDIAEGRVPVGESPPPLSHYLVLKKRRKKNTTNTPCSFRVRRVGPRRITPTLSTRRLKSTRSIKRTVEHNDKIDEDDFRSCGMKVTAGSCLVKLKSTIDGCKRVSMLKRAASRHCSTMSTNHAVPSKTCSILKCTNGGPNRAKSVRFVARSRKKSLHGMKEALEQDWLESEDDEPTTHTSERDTCCSPSSSCLGESMHPDDFSQKLPTFAPQKCGGFFGALNHKPFHKERTSEAFSSSSTYSTSFSSSDFLMGTTPKPSTAARFNFRLK